MVYFAKYELVILVGSLVRGAFVNANPFIQATPVDAYAPYYTTCPTTPLLRGTTVLGSSEKGYITKRKAKADVALASWLKWIDPSFDTSGVLPLVALAGSGGSYRALLNEAGAIQAFDARDSHSSVAGLYQALTYQTGLSGGAWLLTSLAANNWPTISYLVKNLYYTTFVNGLLSPGNLSTVGANEAKITADVASKLQAGYAVSIVDTFGRLLGYNLFNSTDGAPSLTLTDVRSSSNFTGYNVPFPIVTVNGIDVAAVGCNFLTNATQYEFTPFEFGSWDANVSAFIQTTYLGTTLTNGMPVYPGLCTAGFDNLGYVAGISSNVFPALCNVNELSSPDTSSSNDSTLADVASALQPELSTITSFSAPNLFATISNPFYKYPRSTAIASEPQLYLADGGTSGQYNPIWPMIQPSRNVSVMVLVDAAVTNTSEAYADPQYIYATYLRAQQVGLTRMPTIPTPSIVQALGLNTHATFFGCNQPNTMTIVWIPLVSYTYPSNVDGNVLQFNTSAIDGIIGNGNAMGTQNNDSGWAECLGCAIMKKSTTNLPAACTACFVKYCYN